MERCEHGEKVDTFCATEGCVWRQGAGCSFCMKKYHLHGSTGLFVQEKDLEPLLRKYKVDSWVKPKVKSLEQTIHAYFTSLKNELTFYIEEVDRKLRTEICYPYLNKHDLVGVYKKLKKKEFKKVQQKEFRRFYQKTSALESGAFEKKENQLYEEQVVKVEIAIMNIFKTFSGLEEQLRGVSVSAISFQTDRNSEDKIKTIFASLKATEVKLSKIVVEQIEGYRIVEQKVPTDIKVTEEEKTSVKEKSKDKKDKQIEKEKESLNKPNIKQTLSSKLNRQKSLGQNNKFCTQNSIDEMKNQIFNLMASTKREKTEPDTKPTVTTTVSQPSSGQRIDSKMDEDTANRNFLSNEPKPQMSISSSIQSLSLGDRLVSKILPREGNQISQYLHNQLPSQVSTLEPEEKKRPFKYDDLRLVVVPFKGDKTLEPSEHSPLLQKRKKFFENQALEVKKDPFELNPIELFPVIEEPGSPPKPKTSTEDEKSLQLLTQAIQSRCEDAIPLLRSALMLAPHNLSAAQYLSFLLLETGNAKECLTVCNDIHQQLQNQMIYEPNLFHINNNRAVALLMLGRYSEAIDGLEKSLSVEESSLTYKNLGDAYHSIGIYQKAVYNYEKSVILKPSGETYYNFAVCLFSQRNYHSSLAMTELALKLSPDIPEYSALAKQVRSHI